MKIVIDASIVVKLFLNEDDTPAARAMIAGREMLAPDLLVHVVPNAAWSQVRVGKLSRSAADIAFSVDQALPIEYVPAGILFPEARKLSFSLDTPIYDCAYWALAMERNADFLTADAKFAGKLRSKRMAGSRLKLHR